MKKFITYFKRGRGIAKDKFFKIGLEATASEQTKVGSRTEVINIILSKFQRPTTYLEIGVRTLESNFNQILADQKFSVDPGLEVEINQADFPFTSDDFFQKLRSGELEDHLPSLFDVIFIDGLHVSTQVDRDIQHSLDFLADDGFIILHDCNPPTEWHAREEFHFQKSPASIYWNGTTWKAFCKWRGNQELFSCCVDTDWGVGILSRKFPLGTATDRRNEFYEYKEFDNHRKEYLNLISFEQFKQLVNQS